MHGIIFNELNRYTLARMGEQGWEKLLREARLPKRIYLAFKSYPDEEAVALVTAASKLTGQPARAILEDFGEYIAPNLLRGYKAVIQPEWSVLDLVEHVERIHDRVRNDPLATPPHLVCRRVAPDLVQVSYMSKRQLCAVGIGFIRGIGRAMEQPVEVLESQCMTKGAPSCEFQVRRAR
ncbi:heme NO-binding domain-containing protein [Pyxidicoccus xibeiensis]|uniref:heme NO-binding domain-containing protein n=1 Tax=Pyxidicoccus xibeiensis TaxID=2906759 RepID=UPI0020A6EEB3|nr:heme NO-binding domain-containing protein [Pyxidicoccus xibeiensis]MCP3143435.1 heme NO-binding domain-containing protein [Pyxidicoccus xibeiensis]